MKGRKRVRRSPEEARRLILDAAEALLSKNGPDAVVPREIAARAGVSRALINHYFGGYDALVEATLHRMLDRSRELLVRRVAELDRVTPAALLAAFFELLRSRQFGRLVGWAFLSGRLDDYVERVQGGRQLADILSSRLAGPSERRVARDDLDYLILLVLAVGVGLSLGRGTLWRSLGREPTTEQEEAFRAWLADLIEHHVERSAMSAEG
ncbi:MAG: helix-turn-helix domain-containing protein [Myxococcota bacterium]